MHRGSTTCPPAGWTPAVTCMHGGGNRWFHAWIWERGSHGLSHAWRWEQERMGGCMHRGRGGGLVLTERLNAKLLVGMPRCPGTTGSALGPPAHDP